MAHLNYSLSYLDCHIFCEAKQWAQSNIWANLQSMQILALKVAFFAHNNTCVAKQIGNRYMQFNFTIHACIPLILMPRNPGPEQTTCICAICDQLNAKMHELANSLYQICTGNFFKMKIFKMKNARFWLAQMLDF